MRKDAFWIAGAVALVRASPAPAPAPAVTPAALLPRVNDQTLAWFSSGMIGSQTVYSPWIYDADSLTYTTSSTWFRRCATSSSCAMYTGCSGGYLVAAGTSTFCGVGGGTSLFCSNHVLYSSLGASKAYSWYWCDKPPLTGYTFYEKQPQQPTGLTDSTTPASTPASTTSDSSSSATSTSGSSTTSAPAQSTTPASSGSSTNVGAIAGGVVGGVAALALVGAAIVYFLHRSRKNKTSPVGPPPSGYAPPPQQPAVYQQPGYPASPNTQYATAYQMNEAKPQGVQEAGGYYSQQPAPYPQGPYDPHMSQHYGAVPVEAGEGVPPSMGPAPQELPASTK